MFARSWVMKKKILFMTVAIITALTCSFGVTACGTGGPASGGQHSHTFAETWTYDGTYHWHAATCGHTEEVSGKSEHSFGSDNICDICGYEKTAASHEHTPSAEWTTDENDHWHICSECGEILDRETHDFGSGNTCNICGYEKTVAPHEHSRPEGAEYTPSDISEAACILFTPYTQ